MAEWGNKSEESFLGGFVDAFSYFGGLGHQFVFGECVAEVPHVPCFFLQHHLRSLLVSIVQLVYLLVVAAHEKAVFGEIQFLARFFFRELDVAGVAKVLDDGRTMGLRLCGSAAVLGLYAFVDLLEVEETVVFWGNVLHLALDLDEADRRKFSQNIFFLVEGAWNAEFLSDFVLFGGYLYPDVRLMNGVAVQVDLHSGLEEIAIGFIANRLSFKSILLLDLLNLEDFIQFFEGNLILFVCFDFFPDQLNQSLLDQIFLEILLLQLLHEKVAIFHLDVHFLHLLAHNGCLLPNLLIFVKQLIGLRLEVIQLVAQLPDLVFSVFLRDGFVQFLDDLPCLLPHLLNFVLDQ